MDYLKKFWPTAFKTQKKDVTSLIIQILIFLVIGIVGGFIVGLLARIPIVNIFTGIIGTVIGLYGLVGIVLCVLIYLDVLK